MIVTATISDVLRILRDVASVVCLNEIGMCMLRLVVMPSLRASVLAGVFMTTAGISTAQIITRLSETVSCTSCSVTLLRLGTLGTDSLDGFLTNYPVWATMDNSSRIFVTLQPPGDLVLMFDTLGQFPGRVGRKGRGPGEFVFPTVVLPRTNGDILIWDFNAAMLTTLDSRLEYKTRKHQPNPPAAVMPDGRLTAPPPAAVREPKAVYGFKAFARRGGIVTNELIDQLRNEDAY